MFEVMGSICSIATIQLLFFKIFSNMKITVVYEKGGMGTGDCSGSNHLGL